MQAWQCPEPQTTTQQQGNQIEVYDCVHLFGKLNGYWNGELKKEQAQQSPSPNTHQETTNQINTSLKLSYQIPNQPATTKQNTFTPYHTKTVLSPTPPSIGGLPSCPITVKPANDYNSHYIFVLPPKSNKTIFREILEKTSRQKL